MSDLLPVEPLFQEIRQLIDSAKQRAAVAIINSDQLIECLANFAD
jgi:hypothetical protein